MSFQFSVFYRRLPFNSSVLFKSHSILYWSASRTAIIDTFQIIYALFRAISNIQLTIMLILKSLLTFAIFCTTLSRALTSDNVTDCVRVSQAYVWVYDTSNFTGSFLPALSTPRRLHDVSITRRFQSWSLTRCFLYTHIPYPHKRLYLPFPLHAHSVFPIKVRWAKQKSSTSSFFLMLHVKKLLKSAELFKQ